MHRLFSEKVSRWLLPAVLILFILEVMTLPLVLGITYSGRSESPDHILTYTKGKLVWDSATGIDENGVAVLDLFDAEYPGVESEDGSNVVAPGTDGYNIVRLKNSVSGSVTYTAVLYRIRTSEDLPVEAELIGSGYTDTASYPLPDGVNSQQVLRAVTGTVKGGEIQDFDISWLWEYENGEVQDSIDTFLGDKDNADEVTVGLYIVVEDNNSYIDPEIPKTGDDSHVGMYLGLMLVSLFMLILLLWDRRKEKECQR